MSAAEDAAEAAYQGVERAVRHLGDADYLDALGMLVDRVTTDILAKQEEQGNG